MRTPATLVGVLVSTVIAVAGCTSAADGTPTPATTSDPSESSESPPPSTGQDNNGAPRVSQPLDAAPFLTNPCTSLTQTQLTELQMDKPGVPDTDSELAKHVGPSCIWQSSIINSTLGVGFITGNKNGLADLYGARERDKYFEETTVNGYPAVFRDTVDERDSGGCSISVGVTDSLAFRAAEKGTLDAQGACARVKQLATAVITTMKAGS